MTQETKKTVCMFCSMGCGLLVSTERGNPIEIEYDIGNPINKGSVCARGNYMFELLGHPSRLEWPRIRTDEGLARTGFEDAIKFIAGELREIKKKHGGDSIGIIMEPNSLNEEIFLGYHLAKEALKTKNFAPAFTPEDRSMLMAQDELILKGEKEASVDDVTKSDSLFIVGDIVTKAPCLSKEINKVKYGGKGNKVIVVDPKKSHTSWFATSHLQVSPGEEAMVLAGAIKALLDSKGKKATALGRKFKGFDLKKISERTGVSKSEIVRAAHDFDASKKGTIVVCSNFAKTQDAGLIIKLAKILCSVAKGDKRVLSFYSGGNSLGSYLTLSALTGGKTYPDHMEILEAARKGKVKALVTFGVDISRHVPSEVFSEIREKTKLIVACDIFENFGTSVSNAVLAGASYAEKEGTVVSSGCVTQEIIPALSPYSGSVTYFEALKSILEGLGGKSVTFADAKEDVKTRLKKSKKKSKENLAPVFKALKALKAVKASDEKPFILLSDDDIVHYGEGSISEKCFWAKENSKEPYIEVSKADSSSLGIKDGDIIEVSASMESSYLKAKISDNVPCGVVSAPHNFEEARRLFDIKVDPKAHKVSLGPETVSIKPEG